MKEKIEIKMSTRLTIVVTEQYTFRLPSGDNIDVDVFVMMMMMMNKGIQTNEKENNFSHFYYYDYITLNISTHLK